MSAPKPPDARGLALNRQRDVRKALHRLGQWIYPTVQPHKVSTEMFWQTSFRSSVNLCGRRGDWTLYGTWRYWDDPATRLGVLRESSIGVTVAGSPLPGLPQTFCVARYDVECYGNLRGRHLNIYQPVVGDGVHWVVHDENRFEDWPLDATLYFLLEELCPELAGAGWPSE